MEEPCRLQGAFQQKRYVIFSKYLSSNFCFMHRADSYVNRAAFVTGRSTGVMNRAGFYTTGERLTLTLVVYDKTHTLGWRKTFSKRTYSSAIAWVLVEIRCTKFYNVPIPPYQRHGNYGREKRWVTRVMVLRSSVRVFWQRKFIFESEIICKLFIFWVATFLWIQQ